MSALTSTPRHATLCHSKFKAFRPNFLAALQMDLDAWHEGLRRGDPLGSLKISVAGENVLGEQDGWVSGWVGGRLKVRQIEPCLVNPASGEPLLLLLALMFFPRCAVAAGVLASVLPAEADRNRVHNQVRVGGPVLFRNDRWPAGSPCLYAASSCSTHSIAWRWLGATRGAFLLKTWLKFSPACHPTVFPICLLGSLTAYLPTCPPTLLRAYLPADQDQPAAHFVE